MNQPLVGLREMLRGLHEHEVDFLVFGAVALTFFGYVRNTEDLDIVVAPDQENIDRVAEWLMSIEAVLKLNPQRKFGPPERWRMQRGANATVQTALGQLDVVQRLSGLPPWDDLVAEAEVYEIDGRRVRVMNRATLIALKRARGTSQDLADIDAIERLKDL
jgi:predicted nucleotidyltransferase